MDLKSMLNDSSSHRAPPQLHTSQSSYDRAAEPSSAYVPHGEKPTSRYTSLTPSNSQSPPASGYFANQSIHPNNSATTPSTGPHSAHTQSPGTYGKPYTPRDALPIQYSHSTSVVSPQSRSAQQPTTPGSASYYPNTAASGGSLPAQGPPLIAQRHSTTWDETTSTNGLNQIQTQRQSPTAQFQAPPVTPLGPPLSHPRSSVQYQRPPSQGYESYRRSSIGSVGSSHSRDYMQNPVAHIDRTRTESIPRQYPGEEERFRERERSVESVSPKTIPRATPQRQLSGNLHQEIQIERQYMSPNNNRQSLPHQTPVLLDKSVESHQYDAMPNRISTSSVDLRGNSHLSSGKPSPATTVGNNMTPKSTHSPLPMQPSPSMEKRPSLKRHASALSNHSGSSSLPPRKRLRRSEIPIFAQSARSTQLRLKALGANVHVLKPEPRAKSEHQEHKITNGNGNGNGPAIPSVEPRWEPSILNVTPYEDLTRKVCDWIVSTIGMAAPPSGGAMFEIEAKVGAIIDIEMGERLNLPVQTEAIFKKEQFRRTKFESTMNMAQHKQLNTFLNGLVQQSFAEAQTSDREVISFDHPKESDEFFELTSEGRRHLQPSIQQWLNPKHKPRVRRTIDKQTGALKAQIIKSRIADLDVYNPSADFDYRISISIESPWEGEPQWLTEISGEGRDRNKDRMSYRHMAYQIDLTQVTYSDSSALEHELEVEISTEQIRLELENLRSRRADKYEDLVKGFVDNVRILCRRGTVGKGL